MKNKVNIFSKTTLLLLSLVTASFIVSCVGDELFRDELPEANSKEDTVFPKANFSYASSIDDFMTLNLPTFLLKPQHLNGILEEEIRLPIKIQHLHLMQVKEPIQ